MSLHRLYIFYLFIFRCVTTSYVLYIYISIYVIYIYYSHSPPNDAAGTRRNKLAGKMQIPPEWKVHCNIDTFFSSLWIPFLIQYFPLPLSFFFHPFYFFFYWDWKKSGKNIGMRSWKLQSILDRTETVPHCESSKLDCNCITRSSVWTVGFRYLKIGNSAVGRRT